MSSEQEIAVVNVGFRTSPFVEQLLHRGDIALSMIANNSSDFLIHHSDPSKILRYHIEFTSQIEIKAKLNIESLGVFEALGQYFEFYNPLQLSTLNYLISRFATDIKQGNDNYLKAWREITKAVFDEDFIFPIFDEIRILHMKNGDVEIPVRQFLMGKEIEIRKHEGKVNSKSIETELEKITGIIDIDQIEKMRLCSEASKRIVNAAAVIIVPTDLVSLYILFQSESFCEALKRTNGEIVFLSPFWVEEKLSVYEKAILNKMNFESNLINIVELIKETVDTIIIDKTNTDLVSRLREAGIRVIVEELNVENQQSQEFFETILKTVEVSLESISIEPRKKREGVADKLVNLFRQRESDDQVEDLLDEPESLLEDISEQDRGKEEELLEQFNFEDSVSKVSDQDSSEDIVLSEIVDESLTDEFEMDIIDDPKDISTIPTPPSKESVAENQSFPETEISVSEGAHFVLPGIDQINQLEWTDFESMDADEQIIGSFIDRALSLNSSGVEVIFSDLLSLQNNPLLVDKIFKLLLVKLAKVIALKPEERIADIVTFLAAHKRDYYRERLEELLNKCMWTKDDKEFLNYLKTSMLIINSSLPIAEEIIDSFIIKHLYTEEILVVEKLRRLLNVISADDPQMMSIIARILVKLYSEAIETEEPNEMILHRIIELVVMFDSWIAGLSIIGEMSGKSLKLFYDSIDEYNIYGASKHIISKIIDAFKDGAYESLANILNGRDVPEKIKFEMLKKKYIESLSKVGSIPLDIFAEKIGLSSEEVEKLTYDLILKEEISAKIELVNGRLYIVQAHEQEEQEDQIVEEEKEKKKPVAKKETKKLAQKTPVKKTTTKKVTKTSSKKETKTKSEEKKPVAKKSPTKKITKPSSTSKSTSKKPISKTKKPISKSSSAKNK